MFVKGVIALLVAAALWGGTVHTSGAGGRERTYVVRPADTLWSIAEREYAGDLATVSFLEELRALGPPVVAVHGNVDEAALRLALPETRVVQAGAARIGMVHDAGPRAGREGRLVARFPGCDAVVYGHTHLPQVARVGEVWVLNPGSPTERRRAPAPTMLELWIDGHTLVPKLIPLGP